MNWPSEGFEPYFDYGSRFRHLNVNLGSAEACQRYHDDWISRYRRLMASWSEDDVAVWSIRLRQSLKLAFSATYFALSSGRARAEGSLAGAYYFAYYSAFHTMWSVLLLHPDQDHGAVANVTHSKMINVFHSSFASGRCPILKMDAHTFVEDLRFLREYYSYRMPLNFPFRGDRELLSAHLSLGGFVKQGIQLANLHSHLIHKGAGRQGVGSARVAPESYPPIRDIFHSICGKAHPSRSLPVLDPADDDALNRLLERGCDLMPHVLMYEHMFDEYMTYQDEHASTALVQQVRSLVYNALY